MQAPQHKMYNSGDPVPSRWKEHFKANKRKHSKTRSEMKEGFEFFALRHWSDTDKQKLADELRPALVIDRSSVVIDSIAGQEIQNRSQIQFLPREQGDAIPNELYTEAARWFDNESEADDEDSEAFVDAIMVGIGVTESILAFDDDPDGLPVCDRIDPMEFYPCADSVKQNFKDGRRHFRLQTFTYDEIRERWPNIDPKDIDATFWCEADDSKTGDDAHVNDPGSRYSEDDDDEDGGFVEEGSTSVTRRYRVLHYQYWVYEPFYKVLDPFSNKIVEMDEERFKAISKNMESANLKAPQNVRLRRKRFYQAFLGRVVLEHDVNPCPDAFTWNFITGKRDRARGTWYGLYRAMRDPQLWGNKWFSQLLHILNSNAKGGLLYETNTFVDQEQAEAEWARPDAMIEVREGAIANQRIKERMATQFPQGYQMLVEFAGAAVREVVGVSLEFLGQREVNQPGVLEYQRRQAGMTVLATLFNSLRRYKRGRAKLLLYYIHNHLADGRIIKIVGKDKEEYVPLLQQADAKYDIIISDAPTSPSQRDFVFNAMMQIMPQVKEIVPPQVMLELLEYSPIPPTVVQKIKKVVEAQSPQQEERARIEAQRAVAEINEIASNAKLKDAQAAKAMAEANRPPEGGDVSLEVAEPVDPSEQALNQAAAHEKVASAEHKRAAAGLADAQRTKILAELAKLPSEIDLTEAQAEKTRRPDPKPVIASKPQRSAK